MRIFSIILTVFLFLPNFLFSASMDGRVRRVPKDLTEKLFSDPTYDDIEKLAKTLGSGIGNTQAKVKVFHDWICDNIAYDTDLFTPKGTGKQDPLTVLKKRAGICIGYSNLMHALCYFSKIESVIVTGWSKIVRYPGYLTPDSDHAWNAVKIGGKWQLLDCTWDAGYVDYKTFIKKYSTEYLYLPPEQFIYSHFPEKEEHQFLPKNKIRTKEDFEREPAIPGRFFAYGLSLGENPANYRNSISESTVFDFNVAKSNVQFTTGLYNNGASVENAVFFERQSKKLSIEADVPDKSEYRVYLYAKFPKTVRVPDYIQISEFEQKILPKAEALLKDKKINQKEFDFFADSYYKVEENDFYYLREDLFDTERNNAVLKILKLAEVDLDVFECVLDFRVKAADDYEGFGNFPRRFPRTFRSYNELAQFRLVSPRTGTLISGETVSFQVDASMSAISLYVGKEMIKMKKNPKTKCFEIEYEIPSGIETLYIYGSKDGRAYSGICEFAVIEK